MKRCRIFLVEDEPYVRMLLADQLEDAGYQVEMAENGLSAIRKLQQSAQALDALVTDVRMGDGPNGWQVAKVARELKSTLPVIYLTGDSAAAAATHAVPEGIVLQKPHHRNELLAALDLLLLDEADFGEGDRLHTLADVGAISLWSWIYVSRSLLGTEHGVNALYDIVETSRRNNRMLDISGALMLAGRTFAQIIEGSRGNVDAIRTKIIADDRHSEVTTLWHGPVKARRFGDWTLAYGQSSHFYRSIMTEIRQRAGYRPAAATVVRLVSRLAEEHVRPERF